MSFLDNALGTQLVPTESRAWQTIPDASKSCSVDLLLSSTGTSAKDLFHFVKNVDYGVGFEGDPELVCGQKFGYKFFALVPPRNSNNYVIYDANSGTGN